MPCDHVSSDRSFRNSPLTNLVRVARPIDSVCHHRIAQHLARMCTENIFVAGRYNKYSRNLSQSPWIDKDDVRIKHSVQELIEDGLNKYLKFDKSVFSSSGREDVDVRMLGRGRPFVFKLTNPWDESKYNRETLRLVERYVNSKYVNMIKIRDLQVVTKEGVSKYIKDGEEEKTKQYRALCCCSRKLTNDDFQSVAAANDLVIEQKTPIRVLHRRSLTTRRRKIFNMQIEEIDTTEYKSVKSGDLEKLFTLTLLTEAGTYIKEFVHGDFGRTVPSLSGVLKDCDTDLMELDVMEVHLDWPPRIDETLENESDSSQPAPLLTMSSEKKEGNEVSLSDVFSKATASLKKAETMPRGDDRQSELLKARYLFEQADNLANNLSLFSINETVEDVATNNLKYLLIPAYLAKVATSIDFGPERVQTLSRAEEALLTFLKSMLRMGIAGQEVENVLEGEHNNPIIRPTSQTMEQAMRDRTDKIEKFKRMKMLESRLEELERRVSSGQEMDDEISREYYTSLLKKWVDESLECLEREVRPALFFERNRSSSSSQQQVINPSKDLKSSSSASGAPLTIVKNELQKQVFGLGYPSRPTVTVDEFISKKIKDGDLAFHAHKEIYSNSLQRYAEQPNLRREQEEHSDAERDAKEDKDDEDELKRKRHWDEFKDDNPRGSGNRHNMG